MNLIGPHELRSMMQSEKNLVILDVRREGEWNEGHIEGAKHIYLGHLENRVNELPRNVPIAVVCKTGNRSSFGASILLRAGFKDVYNFLGGIDAWVKSDYPLVK